MGVYDKRGEEMSRYIDADDVANAIYHHFPSVRTMADARSVIEEAPTIDSVSVVHGEWIFRREFVEDTPFTGYRCSNCNYWQGMGAWNFCPNCGARMKGADDE